MVENTNRLAFNGRFIEGHQGNLTFVSFVVIQGRNKQNRPR
jgi:hypothetical protein